MIKILPILLLIIIKSNLLLAQDQLDCSITFNDTVMIGQPMYFEYKLFNRSQNSVSVFYDSQGQNFNDLRRDESFEINVLDSNNKLIPNKISKQDEIRAYSRRTGFQELEEGDSLVYKHWIENWVDLEKDGIYTIECKKEFRLKKEQTPTIGCTSTFVVMPFDSTILVYKIQEIWDKRSKEMSYTPRNDLLTLLCRVNSKNIIPYLDQIIDSSTNIPDIKSALKGLSKFNSDENVFRIISKPFEFEKHRFRSVVAREELLSPVLNSIKHSAIHYLANFDDSLFIPFALQHKNDSYPAIRLYIMQQLCSRKSEMALHVIRENLKDENGRVVSEAKMLLNRYEENKEK